MDDLTIIVLNLVAVGLGALLTPSVTSTSDKLKERRRRKEIARLLVSDIESQLEAIETADDVLASIEGLSDPAERQRFFGSVAGVAEFHNEKILSTVLSDIGLLPTECLANVRKYYNGADRVCRMLHQCYENEDMRMFYYVWGNAPRL